MLGKKFLVLFGIVLVCLTSSIFLGYSIRQKNNPKKAAYRARTVLASRISEDDKRFNTFDYVLKLMYKRNVKTIVETGTARNGQCNCRGDGCSSPIWGQWAQKNKAVVYSVDIDPEAVQSSSLACASYLDHMVFATSDSVEFLRDFKKPIDLLYLDSYDFDISNPVPSQEHHLKEIIAVYPRLHKKSIVLIDDCGLPSGGKGKLVIEYLLAKGWKIALSEYQVVLIQ